MTEKKGDDPGLAIVQLPCPVCGKMNYMFPKLEGGEYAIYLCISCNRLWEAFLNDRVERIWYLWAVDRDDYSPPKMELIKPDKSEKT